MKPRLKLLLTVIIIAPCIALAQKKGPKPDNHDLFKPFKYRCVGPSRGGRVTAVSGITSRPGVFYMGSTGGGVWKTEDYGNNWENISDGYFMSPSIGAIAISQHNPDLVYAGTGSDGIRSNIINGKGVYKSTNGGKSWTFAGLENAGLIGAVEIHPENDQVVFVAAIGQPFQPNPERGIYRTTDGGKNWSLVFHHSDTVGAVDLEFAPGNPEIIYASLWRTERKPWTIISGSTQGGIYKSTDGGNTWDKLNVGLPQGLIGKIDLAVTPADPDRLYALVEAPQGEGGLYRSDNKGGSFDLVSTNTDLLNRPFYYCNIEANPQNPNSLYVLAQGYFRSFDGGKTWKRERTPHGDNHDIWINKKDTLIFIESNDGGANVTTNGGKSWSTQNNQPTAELYQVEVDDQFPYWLYAGQQDNSTVALPSLPPYNPAGDENPFLLEVGGCETGPAVPKPGNPNIVYSNCKGHFSVYNKTTGNEKQYTVSASNNYSHHPKDLEFRFQRVAPIHVSPHNPNVVYHASQYVHKTSNDGLNWEIISPDLTAFEPDKQVLSGAPITKDITGEEYYSAIYSIRESILSEGLIWCGANDGPVHLTRDGGKKWENVTPKGLPAGGRVDCVEPSPHKKEKAYISVLRYQLGDWSPYIYRTNDYGKSWVLLTNGKNGIPAGYPTRVVREDPKKEGLLYAGTEYGMFISFDDGKNWAPFQQNLPVTPVTDIKIFRNDLVLSTMGRSFWILDNISALHQLSPGLSPENNILFKPRDTYRLLYRGNNTKAVPHYPDPAAIIDFYLKEIPADGIKMDILNGQNEIVVSIKSKGPKEEESDQEEGLPYFRNRGQKNLPLNQGMNRFPWDMRHQGVSSKNNRGQRSGPLVAPGEYKVQLWVNGKPLTEPLKILPDPRVLENGVSIEDLKAQEKLALNVRDLGQKASNLLQDINKKIEVLEKSEDQQELVSKGLYQEIKSALETKKGDYEQPMLIDQIQELWSKVNGADQRPSQPFYKRFTELTKQLEELENKYNQLITK